MTGHANNKDSKVKRINLTSSAAAFSLAAIYIAAFVYFGLFSAYPGGGTMTEKLNYLSNHHIPVAGIYFLIYAVFGVVLAVLVVGFHEKTAGSDGPLARLAGLFGAVWVGMVIASGMIFVIGLESVVELAAQDTQRAAHTWHVVTLLTESLGGGNELVGGLWVLLISLCNLQHRLFSRPVNLLGLLVGCAGVATIYPAGVVEELFGLSQLIWFVWIGASFLGSEEVGPANPVEAPA